ncbi:hypothetical protein PM082_024476 [Marasmius tenuissimus]|nr:hypothetical protein PM082_024476 [Marasmius tenuissimus]
MRSNSNLDSGCPIYDFANNVSMDGLRSCYHGPDADAAQSIDRSKSSAKRGNGVLRRENGLKLTGRWWYLVFFPAVMNVQCIHPEERGTRLACVFVRFCVGIQ